MTDVTDCPRVSRPLGHPPRMRIPMTVSRLALVSVLIAGCVASSGPPEDAIVIGAALPFSGPLASTGQNLERAITLAVEDANAAGGVHGRPLYIEMRDSNSGSARGLDEILGLLYEDDVRYLIGPEENQLASELVRDIKGLDRLQLLPSFAAPGLKDPGTQGAWLLLAPPASLVGCVLATMAYLNGARTANAVAARDAYHTEVAIFFTSTFSALGGLALPTVTVAEGLPSYRRAVLQTQEYATDVSVLLAYPETAASLVSESAEGADIQWMLSPLLHDEAFLWNVPGRLLEGAEGVSPSLNLAEECELSGTPMTSRVPCRIGGARAFSDHFAVRWGGDRPLPAAHFYYDAVILLALALEYASAQGIEDPTPQELRGFIIELSAANSDDIVEWSSLEPALARMSRVDLGVPEYHGAAGEYDFDRYGRNVRRFTSVYSVWNGAFLQGQGVACPVNIPL